MHLPTLIVVTLLINLVIGIYLSVLYRRKPKDHCFLFWALSCFSFVLGGTCAALRAFDYPALVTYFIADLLLIAAPALVFAGLVQFSRFRFTKSKRVRAKWFSWLVVLVLLLVHPFAQIINIFSALMVALLFWICSQLLAKSVFNEPVYTRLLRTIFVIHSVIMLIQSGLYAFGEPQTIQTGLPDSTVFTLLSHIMLTTLTALLLPWLSFLKLERKLTLKSQRDGLTNLANRSHFFTSVERRWAWHPHKAVVIMMIDIDHFKAINDQFGHLVGDKVIKSVANILSKGLRSHDLIGRIGGEEFAVFIFNETLEIAEEIAHRLRKHVEKAMMNIDQHQINLTVSIGMVEAIPDEHEILRAFNAADNALYESKGAGRNTVTIGNIKTTDAAPTNSKTAAFLKPD